MYLKHKKTKAIFPFSKEWLSTGKFDIYDPLAPEIEPLEENEKELLKFYTESTISKESCEVELEKCLSDKEYVELHKRLFGYYKG